MYEGFTFKTAAAAGRPCSWMTSLSLPLSLTAQRTAAASCPLSGSSRVLRNSSAGMPAPSTSKTEASRQDTIVEMSFQ